MSKQCHDNSLPKNSPYKTPDSGFETIDALADSFDHFMRPFLVRINPIFHGTVWQGKRYTENHIIVMMAVRLSSPLSPSELSRALKMQKGSLTTIIRNLCKSGMIERHDTPGDERSYRLVITPIGLDFVDHMAAQRRAGFRQLFAGLPETKCKQVGLALETLVKYLGQEVSA